MLTSCHTPYSYGTTPNEDLGFHKVSTTLGLSHQLEKTEAMTHQTTSHVLGHNKRRHEPSCGALSGIMILTETP